MLVTGSVIHFSGCVASAAIIYLTMWIYLTDNLGDALVLSAVFLCYYYLQGVHVTYLNFYGSFVIFYIPAIVFCPPDWRM